MCKNEAVNRVRAWVEMNEDQFPIRAAKACSMRNPDPYKGEAPLVIFGSDIRTVLDELERLNDLGAKCAEQHAALQTIASADQGSSTVAGLQLVARRAL